MKKRSSTPHYVLLLIASVLIIGCEQDTPQAAEAEVIDAASIETLITSKTNEWIDAEMQQDENWLRDNLDDRYILIPSKGTLKSKSEYIKGVMEPDTEGSIEISELQIQVFDGFASSQYVFDAKGKNSTEEWDNHLRCMDVWMVETSEWKLLRTQCTSIAE